MSDSEKPQTLFGFPITYVNDPVWRRHPQGEGWVMRVDASMTESEWLSSDNPKKMLKHLGVVIPDDGTSSHLETTRVVPLVSERKLRLWVAAMYSQNPKSHKIYRAARKWLVHWEKGEKSPDGDVFSAVSGWTDPGIDSQGDPPMALRAALLRDVAGNPFREVLKIPVGCKRFFHHDKHILFYERWLTPDALSLAKAAWDDRRPDGTLAADRMAVLADVLEEAGCGIEELLMHLRGKERCLGCGGKGGTFLDSGGTTPWADSVDSWCVCEGCGGESWLPKEAPCVRGCCAVDLILGKD